MNETSISNKISPIAALIMVKNEELSIKTTIDSVKGYIDIIIVYDTGSSDNTLSIIGNCCRSNGQTLYLKTTNRFNNFAESRNESIEFAETIDVNYLLLLDAGDEFKTDLSRQDFLNMITQIPIHFDYGILKLKWLENNIITEHDGLRFIRNKRNIRYDSRYPVHEQIIIEKENTILPFTNFYLYQNRDLYGESTMKRLNKDVDLFLAATKCRHNYYYLAQTYHALGDIDNAYKYNICALENEDNSVDDILIYSRIIYCALVKNMDRSVIIKYFDKAISKNCQLLEIYLNVLRYCINNKLTDIIDPYLNIIFNFDKNISTHFNHEDFDYNRFNLISKYSLLFKRHLKLGKKACELAIKSKNKEEDVNNLRLFDKYVNPDIQHNVYTIDTNDADDANDADDMDDTYIEKNDTLNNDNKILPDYKKHFISENLFKEQINNGKSNIKSTKFSQELDPIELHGQNVVGVLIMVKNEEDSINVTIESTKDYFQHIIVYDTGSEDNTINIINKICHKNNQKLHLKLANEFKGFPQSRNEAIEFAETVDVKYLLLMDAGDEFKTQLSPTELINNIEVIPSNNRFGVVQQDWQDNTGIISHYDIRFIKNKANCKYDIDYPVHEKFIISANENPLEFGNMFVLFQNRELYGKKTNKRYEYDIKMLSSAKKTPRNYFFLGQTYMDLLDFKNGYIYNAEAYKLIKTTNNTDNVDVETILIRLLYCSISCEMADKIICGHFNECNELFNEFNNCNAFIDAYVYFLHYCIKNKFFDIALPLLEPLSEMKIDKSNVQTTRYYYFNYERWNLISVICLMTKKKIELGKMACQKAIDAANKPDDINNLTLFNSYNITNITNFQDSKRESKFSNGETINIAHNKKNNYSKVGRIICVDISVGLKNIPTHKDVEKNAIGGSEYQLFKLLNIISEYKEVIVFNLNNNISKKVDNIFYNNINEFFDFELGENDIIIIQRFIDHTPKFLDKLKYNMVYVWMHDLTGIFQFIGVLESVESYQKNPSYFKGYLSKFFLNNYNINFIFPSEFSKNYFSNFINKYDGYITNRRLHVIHNILYEKDFENSRDKIVDINLNKIVFASSWFKNIGKIIEVFDYVHKKNKNYILVFMEHGYESNRECENEMKQKFGNNVEILGPQNKEKYAEIIKSALCVLISSFPETFGCVFTESYYLGTPVFADYRSGAVAEHLDKQFVLDYDNPEEVFNKLEWLRNERRFLDIKLDSKFLLDYNIEKWKKLLEIFN